MPKILLVDDEENIRKVTKGLLAKHGFLDVLQAESGKQALEVIKNNEVDLVISDVMMRGMDGLTLYEHVKNMRLVFVLLTAFGTKNTALNAIKKGVYDILAKPYEEQEFLTVVSMALKEQALSKLNAAAEPELLRIFFNSSRPEVETLKKMAEKAAMLPAPVLMTGEKGAGRELLAREIHAKSPAKAGPFIKMNCAAVPKVMFQPELFGAARGEFAGANLYKPGKLELADGGTIFLDDINEMPRDTQDWLLDFLKGKGNSGDARVFAAAGPGLKKEAESGKFSSALYEALSGNELKFPALRERKEDIPKFYGHYLEKYSDEFSVKEASLDEGARDLMKESKWTGNIRGVDNVIRKILKSEKGGVITRKLAEKYYNAAEKERENAAGGMRA